MRSISGNFGLKNFGWVRDLAVKSQKIVRRARKSVTIISDKLRKGRRQQAASNKQQAGKLREKKRQTENENNDMINRGVASNALLSESGFTGLKDEQD
ncbi:MAG: hypothetical protein LBL13_07975 [Bacteroidales bacterium]|nr:hypothetical protein [Bacteroidales bacterium]